MGTHNWRGGITKVGENGPELINLRRGASITSAAKTAKLAGKSVSLSYSPQIKIQGNATEDIDSALDMSYLKFKKYAEQLKRDNARLSFA